MEYKYSLPEEVLELINKTPQSLSELLCFRITYNSPPIDGDFVPQRFSQPKRIFKDKTSFYGVSVFSNFMTTFELMLSCPQLGSYIHKGIVKPKQHGPIKKIKEYHYDWYPYKKINGEDIFNERIEREN